MPLHTTILFIVITAIFHCLTKFPLTPLSTKCSQPTRISQSRVNWMRKVYRISSFPLDNLVFGNCIIISNLASILLKCPLHSSECKISKQEKYLSSVYGRLKNLRLFPMGILWAYWWQWMFMHCNICWCNFADAPYLSLPPVFFIIPNSREQITQCGHL